MTSFASRLDKIDLNKLWDNLVYDNKHIFYINYPNNTGYIGFGCKVHIYIGFGIDIIILRILQLLMPIII